MCDPMELAFEIGVATGKSEELGREIQELLEDINESQQSTKTAEERTDNGS